MVRIMIAAGTLGPILAIAAAAATSSYAAAPAVPATYSNGNNAPWTLVERNGEDWCVVRSPIRGSAPFDQVSLSPSLGARSVGVTLIGPMTRESATTERIAYQVEGFDVAATKGGISNSDGKRRAEFEVYAPEAAKVYAGATLAVAVARNAVYVIDTKRLAEQYPAWDACQRRGLIAFGADPAMVANVAIDPQAKLIDLFSDDDYPRAALRAGQQGRVEMMLIVDITGRIRECGILESSHSSILDMTSCQMMQSRARFEPALDRAGHAVEAAVVQAINWQLP